MVSRLSENKQNNNAEQNLITDKLTVFDDILFIAIVIWSLWKSFTILGAVRGIVYGIIILYCHILLDEKRYVAVVIALIFGFILDIVFKMFIGS